MIRKFILKQINRDDEYSEVNAETGELNSWRQDRGLIYSSWRDNIFRMGWKSVDEFIKNRRAKKQGWEEITEKLEAVN